MSKFLVEASLTTTGVKGVQSEGGTARREAVTKAVESVGGRLDSFFFGFGDRDVYVIADFPDNESAAAMAIAVNSSGAVATRTVVLLTPEEVDRAVKRSVEYRPPGAWNSIPIARAPVFEFTAGAHDPIRPSDGTRADESYGDASIVRIVGVRRALCHALSCLAARGGRLHCPDDAQAELREDAALLLTCPAAALSSA